MVGLVDLNIKLNARIRVGNDFGRIKYLGIVSHRRQLSMKIFILKIEFYFIRLRDMKVLGSESIGMMRQGAVITVL